MDNNKKISSFQGIRGYAIILIFISHCCFFYNKHGDNAFSHIGGLGVSIFIMLSGYLLAFQNREYVSLISIEKIKKSLIRFYPLHVVTLLLSMPLSIGLFLHGNTIRHILCLIINALLLQAWVPFKSVYFSYNAVSWYLSLNMYFIILGPVTQRIIMRIKKKLAIIILILVLAFEVLWCFVFNNTSVAHWIIYILPAIRYVDFLAGGLLFKYVDLNNKNNSITSLVLLLFSFVFTTLFSVLSINSNSKFFSVSIWYLPALMLIMAVALGNRTSKIIKVVFSNRVILYIGNLSFELFLFHQLIIRYLSFISSKFFHYNGAIIYILAFPFSLLSAELWKNVEKRIKTYKSSQLKS